MIVYHGTTEKIELPEVKYSKRYLDFGKGFYLTTYEEQAQKWAMRKGMRQGKLPVVNVYELKDNLEEYRVLSFEKENEKWLEFVCACRRGEERNKEYDIIKAVADIKQLELRKAFDIYYSSKLAEQIADSR